MRTPFDTDPDATAATAVDGPGPGRKAGWKLERGAALGRYIVLGPLGRGGMGMVYKAYDPELDRRIALKLLRVRHGSSVARDRLLREAQALAQLSHPNVIAVHDVGSIDGDLFIAMELVEGQTLRTWLEARPRQLREILAVFVAAGRGLAAAHEAGLVHRDFKPDNMVIGSDGRPRVIDFGLARASGDALGAITPDDHAEPDQHAEPGHEPEDTSEPDDAEITSRSKRLSAPLTQAGSVLGTPAYMAPEQHRGGGVDARSDQFSFCVTLWRAVAGVHPFMDDETEHTDDVEALLEVIGQGALRGGETMPGWLRMALARGMSLCAADRHESMASLIALLGRDRAAGRKRLALSVGVGVVACAVVFGVFGGRPAAPEPCQGGDERWSAAWTQSKRDAISVAFTRLRGDDGAAAAVAVSDVYAELGARWVAMYTEACRATQVLGQQSEDLLDRRMACLSRRLEKASALASVLASAEQPRVVDRAVIAARALPGLAICADRQALAALIPPPDTPEQRARVDAAHADIDQLEALLMAGDIIEASERAEALAATSVDIDHPPLTAEALFLHGIALRRQKKGSEAEKVLERAVLAAAAAHDDDRIAQIWVELLWVIGYTQKRIDDGLALRTIAEAAVTRTGEPTRRADLMNNIGALLRKKGELDAAREALETALEIWIESYGPDHVQVSKAHNNLGNVLTDMGRYREGRDHHQRAIEIRTAELGANHPATASSTNNLGNAHLELGEYAEARDAYERALAIYETRPGTGDVTMALNNLGSTLAELGDIDGARAMQRRAIELQRATLGPDDSELGISMNNLADIELRVGNHDAAMKLYEEARGIWTRGLGANHTYVGFATTGVGFALLGLERWPEALTELHRALALWKAAHGDSHPPASAALLGIGLAELGRGRPQRAIAPLERAIDLRADGAPTGLAEARFALTRALTASGRDRARAWELAEQARAAFKAAPAATDRLREVDEWRAKHASTPESPR